LSEAALAPTPTTAGVPFAPDVRTNVVLNARDQFSTLVKEMTAFVTPDLFPRFGLSAAVDREGSSRTPSGVLARFPARLERWETKGVVAVNGTRWLAVAASSLAVVLGGGAALAATGSSNPVSDFLGDVAKRLGIRQDRLEVAIQDATIARIDAAVAAGDVTKAEGDTLKQRVRSGDMPPVLPGIEGPPIERVPFGLHGAVGRLGPELLDASSRSSGNSVDKLVESRFGFGFLSGGESSSSLSRCARGPDADARQWFVVRDADRPTGAELIVSRLPEDPMPRTYVRVRWGPNPLEVIESALRGCDDPTRIVSGTGAVLFRPPVRRTGSPLAALARST
jgi:hypothetical protein